MKKIIIHLLIFSLIYFSFCQKSTTNNNNTSTNKTLDKEALRQQNSKKFYENVDKIIAEMGLSESEKLTKENLIYIFKRIFQKSEDEINKKNSLNNTKNQNLTEKEIEHQKKKKEKVSEMIEKMTKYFAEDLPSEINKSELPKYLNIDTYANLVKKLLSGMGLGNLYDKARKVAAQKAKGDL